MIPIIYKPGCVFVVRTDIRAQNNHACLSSNSHRNGLQSQRQCNPGLGGEFMSSRLWRLTTADDVLRRKTKFSFYDVKASSTTRRDLHQNYLQVDMYL